MRVLKDVIKCRVRVVVLFEGSIGEGLVFEFVMRSLVGFSFRGFGDRGFSFFVGCWLGVVFRFCYTSFLYDGFFIIASEYEG